MLLKSVRVIMLWMGLLLKMKTVLKNCKFIVTQNSNRDIWEKMDILISRNIILRIGKDLHAENEIDCSQNIVMPGLINLHTHVGMQLLRGIADDMPLDEWLEKKIFPAEAKLTPDKIYVASTMAIREMLRTGTTCFNDMYMSMDRVAEAAEELGIRAFLSRGLLDVDGSNKSKERLEDSTNLYKYIKKLKSSRINFAIGPYTPFTCSKDLLLQTQKLSKKKYPVHIHVAETQKEVKNALRDFGKSPVEYLESINFLKNNVIAVHCCWITKEDTKILADKNVTVVHCPRSNMKLASGSIMPLRELQKAGILVGLGTDSAVSNNNLDMFEEMRSCAYLQKQNYCNATVAPAQKVLDMATINGAKALNLRAGTIKAGNFADLVLLDAKHFLLQPLEKDRIVSHLVYSANGSCVDKVFVNGKKVI